MKPLIPQRGAFGTEYAEELIEFIERTNCRKGCVHATPNPEGWIDCGLGLLTVVCLSENQEVPEFEQHGNRYVVCTKRKPPPERKPDPPVDMGPDLFTEG